MDYPQVTGYPLRYAAECVTLDELKAHLCAVGQLGGCSACGKVSLSSSCSWGRELLRRTRISVHTLSTDEQLIQDMDARGLPSAQMLREYVVMVDPDAKTRTIGQRVRMLRSVMLVEDRMDGGLTEEQAIKGIYDSMRALRGGVSMMMGLGLWPIDLGRYD